MFSYGLGFLSHGGLGVWFITDLEMAVQLSQLSQTAEAKDYIYSVAGEV